MTEWGTQDDRMGDWDDKNALRMTVGRMTVGRPMLEIQTEFNKNSNY